MNESVNIDGHCYADSGLNSSHNYLLPALRREMSRMTTGRLFDLGCGNGSIAAAISKDGWDVTGVDVSREGIEQARCAYPERRLETGSGYNDLAAMRVWCSTFWNQAARPSCRPPTTAT